MSLNVLVVDDSATMRAVIVKTLQISGLDIGSVHHAANGKQGLAILDEKWIDIALIDINMPVMGGLEMIERVREDPSLKDLSIVVVSTESSEARIGEIKDMGLKFVHKPFTPEEIREVIL